MHSANSPTPERHTLKEVARDVRVHLGTVYRWTLHGVRGKRLRSHLIGGRRYVYPGDLAEFLSEADEPSRDVDVHRAKQAQAQLDSFGVSRQRGAKK